MSTTWSTFVGKLVDICGQLCWRMSTTVDWTRRSRRGAADVQEAIAKGIRGNSRPSPQVATIHPRSEKASKKADVWLFKITKWHFKIKIRSWCVNFVLFSLNLRRRKPTQTMYAGQVARRPWIDKKSTKAIREWLFEWTHIIYHFQKIPLWGNYYLF